MSEDDFTADDLTTLWNELNRSGSKDVLWMCAGCGCATSGFGLNKDEQPLCDKCVELEKE